MKKQLLLLFTMLLSVQVCVLADDSVVFDFTSGYVSKQDIPVQTVGDVTLTPDKGKRNSGPRYGTGLNAMVVYATNTLTFACETKSIAKVEFEIADLSDRAHNPYDSFRNSSILASDGAMIITGNTSAEWSNSHAVDALTVTPIANTMAGYIYVSKITVHLVERQAAVTYAEVPVITPAGGLVTTRTEISMTTGTPGGEIYYTLDGRDPEPGSASTSKYTDPIFITESCVIKAVTVAEGMEPSSICAKSFELPVSVADLAEFKKVGVQGEYYSVKSAMTVVYRCAGQVYVQDGSASMLLVGDALENPDIQPGSVIDGVTGSYDMLYGTTPILQNIIRDSFKLSVGEKAKPKEMNVADITLDMIYEYIIVKNASITSSDRGEEFYTITDASGSGLLRNNFLLETVSVTSEGKTVDVELLPMNYNGELRLYPIKVIDPENPDPNPGTDPVTGTAIDPLTDGDGTPDNPYSISQAMSLGLQFQRYDWVKGFIVGSCENPWIGAFGTPTFGTDPASKETLLLAPSADCKDFDKCLKLILLQGSVLSELNLADNPQMLGRYVSVYGLIGSEYQCMTTPSMYEFLQVPGTVTSVKDVDADESAPVYYYNLQGMPVNADNLRSGNVYIRRQGMTSTKVIVR